MVINRKALVLIGPPGSGKSSIANRLMEDKNITAVETGNLLRDEVERGTETGSIISQNMNSGRIVPSGIVKEVVLENLESHKEETILFDGFPRVPDQIEIFEEIIDNMNIRLIKVIILELEDEIIMKRLTGRRICSKCGTIFNIHFDPPADENKCSKCGGSLKQRSDDKPEIVKERIEFYKKNTLPAAEYLIKKYPDISVKIDAGRKIDLTTEEIKKYI